MKRVISILLLLVMLCVALPSCGSTPLERADAYIKELNYSYYEHCSWESEIKYVSGLRIYTVVVHVPYESPEDVSKNPDNIPIRFNNLIKEVGPKIEYIISEDETIEDVWILFQYGDGNASNWYYSQGKLKDINELT